MTGVIMDIINTVTASQLRTDLPEFKAGDTVRVHARVIEGEKERIQIFEGVCIRRRGSGVHETFTVHKVSNGIGVERTFPVHSPRIAKLEKTLENLEKRLASLESPINTIAVK